ncbi:MAG: TIR domain-containing protein [Gammaproteobacteria bacterium]
MSTSGPVVYISYASPDVNAANAVVNQLEGAGFACWIAPRNVVPGALYAEEIVRAINECSVLVLVLSAHSVASTHVGKELERASSKNKRILTLRIDATPLPSSFEYFLSESQWIDVAAGGLGPATVKLAEAVRHHQGPGTTQPVMPVAVPLSTGSPSRRTMLVAAAMLLLALIATTVWKLWPAASVDKPPVAGPTHSIAVLPFVNMSSDKEQDYFADGLSEELLNELAQIDGLRVAARTSSFSFKGKNEDLRVISEQLGVGNILEGSVRKNGNRVRITTQLISGKDGIHLWSQTYDRDMNDIFAVQTEIATAVANALSITLDVGRMSRARGGTTNLEAYDKYLRAVVLFRQAGPKELAEALQLYREAVKLDPSFSRAWVELHSALATSLIWLPENGVAAQSEMSMVSKRLIELAPDAWWTKVMLTRQFLNDRRWADAESAANAALADAPPSETSALDAQALFLWAVGRVNEAAVYRDRVAQIDPLSLFVSGTRQLSLEVTGRSTDAEYQHSKQLVGDRSVWEFFALRRLWMRKDVTAAQIDAQYRVFLQHSSLPMTLNKTMTSLLNNKPAAAAEIRKAIDDPANQDQTRMIALQLWADHFGDRDLVSLAFRHGIELRMTSWVSLWRPFETGFRADPRFKDMLREVGLADYFRATGKWGDFCKPVGKDDFECH